MASEQDSARSPTATFQRARRQFLEGEEIAVITDDAIGYPSKKGQFSCQSLDSVMQEYGRMHLVYVSKNDDVYYAYGLVYDFELAQSFADDLVQEEEEIDFALVTMLYDTDSLIPRETRNKLDTRGHHYLTRS